MSSFSLTFQFLEHQNEYVIGTGKYKDKISIEELKNLTKEQTHNAAQKHDAYLEDLYEFSNALEILLEGKESKKNIIDELQEIATILNSQAIDIAQIKFKGENVPYDEIEEWRKEYQKKLIPHIESLKVYFSSSRKELVDEIVAIREEL